MDTFYGPLSVYIDMIWLYIPNLPSKYMSGKRQSHCLI